MTQTLGDTLWIDNSFIEATTMAALYQDRGFTLGDGLFETLYWTGSGVRFFMDHMARLSHGIDALGIAFQLEPVNILEALHVLAAPAGGQPCALRLTLTRGAGPRGLAFPSPQVPRFMATAAPIVPRQDGLSVMVSSIARACGAPSARHKTLSYIDNVIALDQAKKAGFDDGLLQGTQGCLACATSANIIISRDGKLVTPPVSDGALPGIVRGRLVSAGLIEEATIVRADLTSCQAMVLTNSLIGALGVNIADGQTFTGSASLAARIREAINYNQQS